MCPDCQEGLALGQGAALIARTELQTCSVCGRKGTLRFLTFPLEPTNPVEMDLCAAHFRALLSRRLDPVSYQHLRTQLQGLGLEVDQVFLLHDAFYDRHGRALQPAAEGD
jgi:hypothetical protein